MTFPRIYLALDNCFASKRWTQPAEWMHIARDAGVYYIEASADNECDPLYTPPEVLRDWVESVRQESDKTGVRLSSFYSGHGTYATLGLAHPDIRVRDHIQHQWLEPMIRMAASLDAGFGFFCHAFPQSVLSDPNEYDSTLNDLRQRLADLSQYAASHGLSSIGVEQMYSPHQIPWTISGSIDLLRAIFHRSRCNFYLTLDTGHQIGQRHYLEGEGSPPQLRRLVAQAEDTDLYAWLRKLGSYSPIIHLQQTDGTVSAHRPFTQHYNANGIVHPRKVLDALWSAYHDAELQGMPKRCDSIYLTLEIFSGTAQKPQEILGNIRESIDYWRQFIPEDGCPLDELVENQQTSD
jgi:D-erythrulose 1-phosphate 3-epimerase